MYKDSIYTKMYQSGESVKDSGYNYRKGGMADKFFSNRMWDNPVMEGFLKRLDPWFIEMTDSVKKIQLYNNFTIDKNDGTINL
jgi:hypothetical protein